MTVFPSRGPSARDIRASVAKYLADQLLAVPYALYWYDANALQTDAGTWWASYREQQATHLANPALQTALQQAAGIFALVDPPEDVKDWVVVPSTNGSVPPLGSLPLPHAAIDVDPLEHGRPYELGTRKRWAQRTLSLDAIVRNTLEQDLLADALNDWFRPTTVLTIHNWDSGNGATVLGTLDLTDCTVSIGTTWADASAVRHYVSAVVQTEFVT